MSNPSAGLIDWFRPISERHIHGNKYNDDWKNGKVVKDHSSDRLSILLDPNSTLECHCRYIASSTISLTQNRHPAFHPRLVELISSLKPEDAKKYRDEVRHTVIEVYYAGKWSLVDVDMGILFKARGLYLSVFELQNLIWQKQLSPSNVERLTNTKLVNNEQYPYLREVLQDQTNEGICKWYGPLANAIMINHSFFTHDTSPANILAIHKNIVDSKRADAQFVTLEEFEKFYRDPLQKTGQD